MDTEIICYDCGRKFIFTDKEQLFYQQKGYKWPKRCRDCRDLKKERNLYKGDYKVSSIFEDFQVFGMRMNVAGGIGKDFVYGIEAKLKDDTYYIAKTEETYKIVKIQQECTYFKWYEIKKIIKTLTSSKEFMDYSFENFPKCILSNLRD